VRRTPCYHVISAFSKLKLATTHYLPSTQNKQNASSQLACLDHLPAVYDLVRHFRQQDLHQLFKLLTTLSRKEHILIKVSPLGIFRALRKTHSKPVFGCINNDLACLFHSFKLVEAHF